MCNWFSSIPIVAGNMPDKCVWREAENGGYTVKTAYQVALSMSRMHIDSLACRSLLLKQTGTYGSTGFLPGELVLMLYPQRWRSFSGKQ
ncbi:hypothetical protein NC652_012200 [Populus alba x Populus x berolinensis]|uniref:Uncharacterized protein n=1 Tax=Populus alba x Populus x berolinensis TaxID=444605 RepID=A0AAD6R4Q4_9ROSI|nr:hypothetical protein NC652_012200 [Populus alba x Populus x berolinensis]KAJ7002156.1 hypothetical protein NC653_012272 [Populus alba x Populus x berolinensis]